MGIRSVNPEGRQTLLNMTSAGSLYRTEEKDAVRCYACGHRCFIPSGLDGICKVRHNDAGTLRVPWGYVGGMQDDPIEKKPFFHVLPGSRALSFGMLGCDLHCGYCQNWMTSQTLRDPRSTIRVTSLSEEEVVETALRVGARVLTSTYNEPLITAEWSAAVFDIAKARGLVTSFVSNGNATPEVLEFLRPRTDLYKVDLKTFQDKNYRQLGGVLERITDSVARIYQMGFWLELVTLLVPGFNDDPAEISDMANFIRSISPLIPWHITAFRSDYRMKTTPSTTSDQLLAAGEIARKAGLRYVYLGNCPGLVDDWESTFCHECGERVIERSGFKVMSLSLNEGKCPKCSTEIPGFWTAPS